MFNIMHIKESAPGIGAAITAMADRFIESGLSKIVTWSGWESYGRTGEAASQGGVKIVLTASSIEMSDFNLNPFLAFAGGFPQVLVQKKLYPPVPSNEDGSAKFAPYGLRKVESLLIDEFGEENVVVTHPHNLHRFIGPNTEIIGITTMDPLGTGFVSRTYTSILGLNGRSATLAEFEDLMNDPSIRGSKAKVIVGGSGAWQISELKMQDALGVTSVLMGQAERSLPAIMRDILRGSVPDRTIPMDTPSPDEVPLIKKPAIYGTVEIMRGCGRGCSFCSPTLRHCHSFLLDHIVKEAEVNVRGGTRMIILQTDDVFLYRGKERFLPNKEAIVGLFRAMGMIEGMEYLQVAHASLAPVVYDPSIVEGIAPLLVDRSTWTCRNKRCASVEVGIESGSPRLMRQHMRGKMLPYPPEQWPDVVVRSIEILNDHDIYPLATLILGLPGETDEDIHATVELLERLDGSKLFYVPLLFTSEEESKLRQQRHGALRDLDEDQWGILSSCWKHNIDVWSPERARSILLASTMSGPYFWMKHGSKVLAPILRVSGLEDRLIGRKAAIPCQPNFCTPEIQPIEDAMYEKTEE